LRIVSSHFSIWQLYLMLATMQGLLRYGVSYTLGG
jgi:hypothetical protein